MRVTNSMISNNASYHIANAKNMLMLYEEQYTTQKKIQRPSDDPTVAVRSLKLRNTYSQIKQYAEKNIQDAIEWMDTTESSMSNIGNILTYMKTYMSQGVTDTLDSTNRTSVLEVLQQYASAIFEDEANADYSGRYVFTGYRTDTSLVFSQDTTNLNYEIKENFDYTDIDNISVVTGGATYSSDITQGQEYVDMAATTSSVYRIQLAYDNCSNEAFSGESEESIQEVVKITYTSAVEEDAEAVELSAEVRSSKDEGAYVVEDDQVVYIYDTGEILMGAGIYTTIKEQQAELQVTYCKDEFNKGDIRPEMYFECMSYDRISGDIVDYVEPSNQDVKYEINYSQTLTVNTQAKDAIDTDIYRVIDYIAQTIKAVDDVEKKIEDVEKMISNTDDSDESTLSALNSLKETLESELSLRNQIMSDAFGKGLTMVDEVQQKLNVAVANLGAKYKRAQLTHDKLLDEETDTEEKLSENEDVDLADVYINLTQANNLYQASLSATAKILGNSLLDYI